MLVNGVSDENLARFDRFVEKLKEKLSIASETEEAEARQKKMDREESKTAGNLEKCFLREKDQKLANVCVYCEKPGHKSCECELLSETLTRRLTLPKRKSCLRCKPEHRPTDCRNKNMYQL